MRKPDIKDLSYDDLIGYLQSMGEPAFRAKQIFEWIYKKGATRFSQMTNLSGQLQKCLESRFSFMALKVVEKKISLDKTMKVLFALEDSQHIETVLIPTAKRATVCVSTQVGCKFGCHFCASGIGGWKRDLTSSEILDQILSIKALSSKKALTHIVFMGVGEPFDNYASVIKAIGNINSNEGMKIAARRITISTCGLIPEIKKFSKEGLQVELSISLHGYDNSSRDALMPINQKYPFDELMQTCREYSASTKRQITFEYILIKDLTCTEEAARSLQKAFKGIICKMNLIVYNPVEEFEHKKPSRRLSDNMILENLDVENKGLTTSKLNEKLVFGQPLSKEISIFKDCLEHHGIHATIRRPRGYDVSASCGQLRYKDMKRTG